MPPGTIADLTEPGARSFADLVAAVRRWQGWPPPAFSPALPAVFLQALGRIADALGHLGWRSPLRTTALKALEEGIRGDPEVWRALGGRPCRALDDTLALLPATRQERLFARAWLGLPLAIGTLAMFWTLSGLLALLDPARAMSVLTDNAVPRLPARLIVTGGALADIVLGVGVLWRNWTKPAALGMLGLSGAYLAGSLAVAPELWADPLGPMIKVFPGMALAALVWLMLEER